jgi:hypothetical protein
VRAEAGWGVGELGIRSRLRTRNQIIRYPPAAAPAFVEPLSAPSAPQPRWPLPPLVPLAPSRSSSSVPPLLWLAAFAPRRVESLLLSTPAMLCDWLDLG